MIPPKPLFRPDQRVKPLRRKPVTIAIGYAYDQGIVFCADTKISTNIKTNQSKIAFFVSRDAQCSLTFAISGADMEFARSSADACWASVKEMNFSAATMEEVHETAEMALADFYRDQIFGHPDRHLGAVDYKLLVGIWLRGETRLFVTHETLLKPVDGYECIGSGGYLANYLIRQYRQANPGPATLEDAALISSFAVDAAIDYDEGCGGENEILIVRNDGEASNGYDTAMYPGMLVGSLQRELWRLLHHLANLDGTDMKAATAAELEKTFDNIRGMNESYAYAYRRR